MWIFVFDAFNLWDGHVGQKLCSLLNRKNFKSILVLCPHPALL